MGMVRSAILFGLVNAVVALWSTYLFRDQIGAPGYLRTLCFTVILLLGGGMAGAERISSIAEDSLYADDVILSRTTRYQRIVLTRWKDDIRLFLSSHLQFSSRDEYRYHEALVHPGLSAVSKARRVLVLGGGDGLAVREALRYPGVEQITLVDLDPEMTRLFSTNPMLLELNSRSLLSPKVRVVNADAFPWLAETNDIFDFVVIDFPDPTNFSLGKLYTTAFYRLLKRHLSEQAFFVVQSTSPLFARQSYWCIVRTIEQAGLKAYPYHAYVPSFGEWGFVLAGIHPFEPPSQVPGGLRFLTAENVAGLFQFPMDMRPVDVEPNRLNDQVLVRYYEREWSAIAH
jgi:spermidine synthase